MGGKVKDGLDTQSGALALQSEGRSRSHRHCASYSNRAKWEDRWEARKMIMRVYRCTVVEGKEAEFREFAYNKSHPWLRERPGLIAFYAGRPLPGNHDRSRCMMQIWESTSAIEAAIGADWRQPPILPEEARGFIETASVEYYELADEFRAAA
jgi:heme-degrading monooxygenase HmoA